MILTHREEDPVNLNIKNVPAGIITQNKSINTAKAPFSFIRH
jgi:hypothetical protein